MGVTLSLLERLRSLEVFEVRSGKTRVLDVGSSNLYQAEQTALRRFVDQFPEADKSDDLDVFCDRVSKGSRYDLQRGGLNEAWSGELLERCGMQYLAIDIAQGYKTEIFDLNLHELSSEHTSAFDVVMNCGTTEHLLNQFDAFKTIHNATCLGGFMVHQLPIAGFTDHGYFSYTGRFFFDLAGFNDYDLVDLWYDGPSGSDDVYLSARSYASALPRLANIVSNPVPIPNWSLTVVYRKRKMQPFAMALETTTSVGRIPAGVFVGYGSTRLRRLVRRVQRVLHV